MENKNLLIDTHAHVNFRDFKNDAKEVIKRALDENVWMINIGAESKTSERAVKIAEEHKEGVYSAVGLHPSHLIEQEVEYEENGELIKYKSKPEQFDYDFYLNLAKNKKVVGIGECGLDYFKIADENFKEKQKEVFIKHIDLANETGKPLIIHCREAHEDLLEILRAKTYLSRGVIHFFGGPGSWENVQNYLDMGFYISLAGVITFSKYSHAENIKHLPMERILTETDCPYVAPVPYRGKRNEPLYVKYTARKIAEIKGLSFEEVAKQTTKNARNLFKI